MLKKLIKLVYVIPIYFILFIFQNSRLIYNNKLTNVLWYSNAIYISKSMIIYIIAILFSIMFLRKNYRKVSNSIIFVVLTTNLINGIYPLRNLDKFVLIYLYLLFLTYIVTYITNQKFEISIFITTSAILILSYILALFNLLIVVKYLIYLSLVLGTIFIIYKHINKNNENQNIQNDVNKNQIRNNFNTTTLVIFSIFFVVLIAGGINRYVSSYDEYSHWAFDAKSVITYNKLSTCSEVDSRTRDYPPMLSLWHYFVSKFTGFNEENLYIGISIFTLIFLMPSMSIINKKNKILKFLIPTFLVFSCYLLNGIYSYGSLYADLPFAIVFLNCFAIYQNYREKPKIFNRLLSLNLIILILTKPTGFVLASCFVLMLMVEDYIKIDELNKKIKISEKLKKVIKNNLAYIILILITLIVWYGYIKIMNVLVKDYYSYTLIPGMLSTSIGVKLKVSVMAELLKSFIQAFNETVISGFIPLNLYQFILLTFGLMYLLYYFRCDKSVKKANKKLLPILISYFAYFILIILAIFVMFSVYEAQNLASFVRYLDSYNLVLVIYLIVYAFSDEFYIEKNKVISVGLLILLLLEIPYKSITYVLYDYQNKITAQKFSTYMNKKFEIVRENTKDSDKIYVLDQNDKDGIMAMWYARYYVFPRKTNASGQAINWKIQTSINSADLQNWGMTASDLSKNLYDYNFNYLYLYSFDNYMFDKMKDMFSDFDKAKKSTLFKVEKQNDEKVKLIPVA